MIDSTVFALFECDLNSLLRGLSLHVLTRLKLRHRRDLLLDLRIKKIHGLLRDSLPAVVLRHRLKQLREFLLHRSDTESHSLLHEKFIAPEAQVASPPRFPLAFFFVRIFPASGGRHAHDLVHACSTSCVMV